MNCKNCNAVMRVDEKKKLFVCPYCDSTEPFDNMTQAEVAALVQGAISDIRDESRQMMNDMAASHQKEMKRDKTRTLLSVVAIVLLGIVSFVVFIMMLFGFDTEYKASGVVACIQLILLIAAIVLKAICLCKRNKKISFVSNFCVGVAAFLVPVWFVSLAFPSPTGGYEWPATGYAAMVPQYGGKLKYSYQGSDGYRAEFQVESEADFAEYVQMCKDAGFTIDPEEKSNRYLAYNEQDYELSVDYRSYSKTVYVTLDMPIVMEEFYWPSSGVAQKVPRPEAEKSYVESFNSNSSLRIYVGDLTREEFLEYLETCMNAGFEGYYYEDSGRFSGRKGAVSLTIEWKRNRIMYVSVSEY